MRAARTFAIDLACVVVFVLIGRRNHGEGTAFAGFVRVAAPFVIALDTAWAVTRKRWAGSAHWHFGIAIWLITVAVGLVLRRFVFGNGTAAAFVIVATLFLGLALVGWRLLCTLVGSMRARAR